MNFSRNDIKRTLLATAITSAIGAATLPDQASARTLTFAFEGAFTLINPVGDPLANPDTPFAAPWYGNRTPIIGTMVFDESSGSGTGTIVPFSFQGGGQAAATAISFQAIGNGFGGPGSLVLGNMGFNWSGNDGIPVSIVLDADGMFEALGSGMAVGERAGQAGTDYVCGTDVSCASPASDGLTFSKYSYTLPVGPSPLATTTWNTANIGGGTLVLGDNPSGTLPLISDTIGGSPMGAGPFAGWNANFDVSNITMTSDGTGSITAPADVVDATVPEDPLPATWPVDLGSPTDVAPAGTAEYCLVGIETCDATTWLADDGTNTITIPITQTVNTINVDWRAPGGVAFDTQSATATVNDTMPPVFDNSPPINDVNVDVNSTADSVCFGTLTASDAVEPNVTVEYSLNGFDFFPADPDPLKNCSDQFGPNANTVFWRVSDASDNSTSHEQTVNLVLPSGIVGKACEIDLDTAGSRLVEGTFIMRNPQGAQTGTDDDTVTGDIDTTIFCPDESCTEPSAALITKQPFEGSLWTANNIRLFSEGTWTFETCPFPRTFDTAKDSWVSADGSNKCGSEFEPNPLSMTVGPGQIGAHMLFNWSINEAIDVVVVWDADCGKSELTTTDPDGDGILSSQMTDGPFKGFNAAFDLRTIDGQPPIAEGGYQVEVPVYTNPVDGASPLLLDHTVLTEDDLPDDPEAVSSCILGGCYDFEVTGVTVGGVDVVLPLNGPLPSYTVYRKFIDGAWSTYHVDENNSVKSAPVDPVTGLCPEPGAATYKAASTTTVMDNMLNPGDECIQLTIQDDGPNDSNKIPGTIADPGAPAQFPAPPPPTTQTTDDGIGGGCSISNAAVDPKRHGDWWLLGGLLSLLGFSSHRRRRNM